MDQKYANLILKKGLSRRNYRSLEHAEVDSHAYMSIELLHGPAGHLKADITSKYKLNRGLLSKYFLKINGNLVTILNIAPKFTAY